MSDPRTEEVDRKEGGTAPSDGPSPQDQGGSSQDRAGGADPTSQSGDAGRARHRPSHPEDSNERADDRVETVEPDGESSPRA
jgi:hypothetical protein